MTLTRTQFDQAIQTYADAYKSGNPNLLKLAAGPLQAILQTMPEQWEVPAPAAPAAPVPSEQES